MRINERLRRIPQIIEEAAARYQVNPKLIAAVIYQGSRGNAYAIRYDRDFHTRRVNSKSDGALKGVFSISCTRETERHGRATYWGLMQVLGQTAREELQFEGDFLTELLDPETNIDLGVQLLKRKLGACASLADGLAAYCGDKAAAEAAIGYMEGLDIDFLLH